MQPARFSKPRRIKVYDAELFSGFDCDCPIVNAYFSTRLKLDIEANNVHCYVTTLMDDDKKLVGFFTLKNKSLEKDLFTDNARRNAIKRIPQVSCIELAYFAIGKEFQKQGLGGALLSEVESVYANLDMNGMLLHLIESPKARGFYAKYGYLPMKVMKEHTEKDVVPYFKMRHQILFGLYGDVTTRASGDMIVNIAQAQEEQATVQPAA